MRGGAYYRRKVDIVSKAKKLLEMPVNCSCKDCHYHDQGLCIVEANLNWSAIYEMREIGALKEDYLTRDDAYVLGAQNIPEEEICEKLTILASDEENDESIFDVQLT